MSHVSRPILVADNVASELLALDLPGQSLGKETLCDAKPIDLSTPIVFIVRSGLACKPSRPGLH
jgi:hypothetical protein